MAAAVMRPFSMITVASMSPCREVPHPEKVPSFHFAPDRVADSAAAGASLPMVGVGGVATDAAALAGAGGGATGAGEVAAGAAPGTAGAGASAVRGASAGVVAPPCAGVAAIGANPAAGASSRDALSAAGDERVADASILLALGDVTVGSEAGPLAAAVSPARGGSGGRRRLALRMVKASAASLVRTKPAP